MKGMEGNPHHNLAAATFDAMAKAGGMLSPAQQQFYVEQSKVVAALSLAYEQRTANLIAYVDKIDDTSAAIPVVNEIKSRLGITNKAKP